MDICLNCKYFRKSGLVNNRTGTCLVNPPVVIRGTPNKIDSGGFNETTITMRPETEELHTCREFTEAEV